MGLLEDVTAAPADDVDAAERRQLTAMLWLVERRAKKAGYDVAGPITLREQLDFDDRDEHRAVADADAVIASIWEEVTRAGKQSDDALAENRALRTHTNDRVQQLEQALVDLVLPTGRDAGRLAEAAEKLAEARRGVVDGQVLVAARVFDEAARHAIDGVEGPGQRRGALELMQALQQARANAEQDAHERLAASEDNRRFTREAYMFAAVGLERRARDRFLSAALHWSARDTRLELVRRLRGAA